MPKSKQNEIVINGLTDREALKRLKKYGENSVYRKKRIQPIKAFIKKFNNPLLIILIIASLISFFFGERVNTIIILLMVFLSATFDFVNSYKSEKAVERLIAKVVTTATVIRNGAKKEIEFKYIVPGDLIFLSAGDVVPADCQVIDSNDFFINQSMLTGESFPAEKIAQKKLDKDTVVTIESKSVVFMGTSVVTGYATAYVLKTGAGTEFGKIAERLNKAEPATDFEIKTRKFSMFILRVTFFLVCLVFLVNAMVGRGWLTSFIFAVAIAIGLTPDMLPMIISVSLSYGSIRMAKKDVIVKNLSAIENFGSMNILCTDKTGTLTQNNIVLVKYVDGFGNMSQDVLLYAYLNSFYHTGVQNPLDNAVKEYKTLDISAYQKIRELPFDFHRRRQSVVVEKNGKKLLVTKGAPEELFDICSFYQPSEKEKLIFTAQVRQKIVEQFLNLSRDGFRVLAVATRELPPALTDYTASNEEQMSLIGFTAYLDPPKDSAQKALEDLNQLGVEVKVLTGDNELLTQKICREINLAVKGMLVGDEVEKLNDLELQKVAGNTTIFARINPEQKERIIILLKKSGYVVGYLGDGINDAPALKAADIGISVNNAVDVAKETADIILLKKSLVTLKEGVIEGRKTFYNTMKYIQMGLSSNFGNMFSMMGASAFLPFLPMLPAQVLLNNFIYDTSQLSLTADTVDDDDVKKPTAWDLKFIKKFMLVFGPISSIFDFATFGVLYFVFHLTASQFQTGWFMESIATQIFVIYIIRTKKIPFIQSRPAAMLFYNTILAVIIAWLVPYFAFGRFFKFEPLGLNVLFILAGIVVIYLVLVEAVKRIFYRKAANKINI